MTSQEVLLLCSCLVHQCEYSLQNPKIQTIWGERLIWFCVILVNSTTFKRVIEKRSTESFSGLPYTIALFNCLLYTFYGSPLISNGWDNIVVMVVNAIGLLLECCFVCIYLIFAPPKPKVNIWISPYFLSCKYSLKSRLGKINAIWRNCAYRLALYKML